MKEITKTNWTVWELEALDWHKCKLQYGDKPEAEWEIYISGLQINFVTNDKSYHLGTWDKKEWILYSWHIYRTSEDETHADNENFNSITIFYPHDERDNVYYDDNGEEIRMGDEVLARDNWADGVVRIFVCAMPTIACANRYMCVQSWHEEEFLKGAPINVYNWKNCIKHRQKEDTEEKKERKLYMTDKERAEFTAKNNIAL